MLGIAESTVVQVGPLVLAALAASNPQFAAAMPAVQALVAAVEALKASGVFSEEQATAAVNTAAQAIVASHAAAIKASA
jgi:cytochrome b